MLRFKYWCSLFFVLSCHYVTVFVCRVLTYDLEQRVLGGYPCHGSVTIAVFREILKTVHQANMFKALFAAFARRSWPFWAVGPAFKLKDKTFDYSSLNTYASCKDGTFGAIINDQLERTQYWCCFYCCCCSFSMDGKAAHTHLVYWPFLTWYLHHSQLLVWRSHDENYVKLHEDTMIW